jgi:hypothetical protein
MDRGSQRAAVSSETLSGILKMSAPPDPQEIRECAVAGQTQSVPLSASVAFSNQAKLAFTAGESRHGCNTVAY